MHSPRELGKKRAGSEYNQAGNDQKCRNRSDDRRELHRHPVEDQADKRQQTVCGHDDQMNQVFLFFCLENPCQYKVCHQRDFTAYREHIVDRPSVVSGKPVPDQAQDGNQKQLNSQVFENP